MNKASSDGSDVRPQMRAFIEDNFLYLQPDVELGDGDDLLKAGIVDSLGFVELVEEVEARYGVHVQDVEITEENFGSIDSIARYVEGKRAAA
jgi:acyl carrier protein